MFGLSVTSLSFARVAVGWCGLSTSTMVLDAVIGVSPEVRRMSCSAQGLRTEGQDGVRPLSPIGLSSPMIGSLLLGYFLAEFAEGGGRKEMYLEGEKDCSKGT